MAEVDGAAALDEEEQAEQEALAAQQKKDESDIKHLYVDEEGNQFNPSKKFGIIQEDSMIYDNITSSYPLNLPTEHYQKYITS